MDTQIRNNEIATGNPRKARSIDRQTLRALTEITASRSDVLRFSRLFRLTRYIAILFDETETERGIPS